LITLKHVDLDKRIAVYPRKLKYGTTWCARFLVEKRELTNGQRYLRESMKTSSEEIAKQKALQRYAKLSVFQNNDFVIKNITLDEGIKRFMKGFKEKSKQGLNGYSNSSSSSSLIDFFAPILSSKFKCIISLMRHPHILQRSNLTLELRTFYLFFSINLLR